MTIPTSLAEKAGRSFLRGAGRAVNAALKSLHIFWKEGIRTGALV